MKYKKTIDLLDSVILMDSQKTDFNYIERDGYTYISGWISEQNLTYNIRFYDSLIYINLITEFGITNLAYLYNSDKEEWVFNKALSNRLHNVSAVNTVLESVLKRGFTIGYLEKYLKKYYKRYYAINEDPWNIFIELYDKYDSEPYQVRIEVYNGLVIDYKLLNEWEYVS